MKILHVVETLARAGTGRNLIAYLANSSVSVHEHWVVSFKPGELDGTCRKLIGQRFIGLVFKQKSPMILFSLLGILRKLKPDLVHTYLTNPNLLGRIARIFTRFPLLVNEEQGICVWRTGLIGALYRHTGFFVDGMIANSNAVKEKLHTRDRMPQNKIVVGYTGIDPSEIKVRKTRDQVREDNGIPLDSLLVVCVIRFHPVKGYNDAYRLACNFVNKVKSGYFVFVGGGEYLQPVKARATADNISDRVLFTGAVDNVFEYLAAADVSVSMSHEEGLPRALIESLFMRVPVVATDVGGTNEIIDHGQNGYLVEKGDINTALTYIEELLGDPAKRVRFGDTGCRQMVQKFLWSNEAQEREMFYDSISGKGKKKILHVIETLARAGTGQNLISFLANARTSIHDHWVLSFKPGELDGVCKELVGERFLSLPFNRKTPMVFFALLVILRRLRPEIVHTYLTNPNIISRFARLFVKIPVLINEERGVCDWRKGFVRLVFTSTTKMADKILANSLAVQNVLVKRDGVDEGKVTVFHTAVDPRDISLVRPKEEVRRTLGIPPGAVICICIIRFHPVKGYVDSFMLAEKITRTRSDLYFVFVGGGEHLEKCRQWSQQKGLDDRVKFTGKVENVYEYLAASDISVSMSHEEGLPRAIIESLYMNVPVVATDVGGTNEVVDHGKNGYLVKKGDTDAAAEFIGLLSNDIGSRAKFGMDGHRKIEQSFLWESAAQKREDFYTNLNVGSV